MVQRRREGEGAGSGGVKGREREWHSARARSGCSVKALGFGEDKVLRFFCEVV
jgi:hypothetical protein